MMRLATTPHQLMGPFYPFMLEPDSSGDLTRRPGKPGRARGELLYVMGRVLTAAGEPVRGAKVVIWQANAFGRYAHPSDTNPAPLDPDFEGFAVLGTDPLGRYRLRTIRPGGYPGAPGQSRPAHIHFDVTGRQDRVVTQMYFEDDPNNGTDPLLQGARRKDLLTVQIRSPTPDLESEAKLAIFKIVLSRG